MDQSLNVVTSLNRTAINEVLADCLSQSSHAEMLCALAGAALFVISRDNLKVWKQAAFALISFVGGIFSSEFISELLSGLLNMMLFKLGLEQIIRVPRETGALVASAVCVTVLLRIVKVVRNYPDII
ncbi:putative holin (plasmid) [Pantoea sp. BJ2]|uniref:Holin n=1 Tax=Pantoea sp. BJ2 TaxID=3141322 RepID=A0AAU7U3W8_9GAMM